MWGQDHVWCCRDRVVLRGRLDREHVESGAGNPAGAERLVERHLIEESATRDIDDNGSGTEQTELTRADQPAGRVGHWQMKCQHIGLGQQFVERCGQPDVFGRLGNEGVENR